MSEPVSGTPLPELPSRLCKSATIHDAYTQVLSLERSEQAAYDCNKNDDQYKRLMCARIVGYLLLEGVSDQAVALEVVSCNNEAEKLLAIGQHHFDHFLRAFRIYKGRTAPSGHVSRPSFDNCREMIMSMIVETPQNHQQAKANALIRDGFRCILSGEYDYTLVLSNEELKKAAQTAGVGATQCAHILPESTNPTISGYNNIVGDLNGPQIHRLENVFTLCMEGRHYFDVLKLWFEPTGEPNTYSVCASASFLIKPGWKKIVTFTTPDPVKLPVPSRDYLELHAACCKVAHLSGAGERIDKILREMEDIQVLSRDGTSAEVLQYALLSPSPLVPVH